MISINSSTISTANALRASQESSNKEGVNVDGNTISWPDDGWYEVQSATSYNTMSEGGRSATLPAGIYNVINHTTGERFENVGVGPAVGPDPKAKDRFGLNSGNDIFHSGGFDVPFNHVGPGDPIPSINDPAEGTRDVMIAAAFDGLNARPAPTIPPLTTTSSTVFSAGTRDETHVITTSSPDTSASTSNQPFTNTTTVINRLGVLTTETTSTSPTGVTYGPAGTNGVYSDVEDPDDSNSEPNDITLETPAATTGTSTSHRTSSNQNSENDSNSHGGGSSGGANAGTGNQTSENPHTR